MSDKTIEKDTDLSTDRDVSHGVERSSFTGSDDKTKTFGSTTSIAEDIGERESVAATLANAGNVGANLGQLLVAQALRHAEELHDRRIRRDDELSVIRQRQLSNSADYDQDVRELRVSHSKSRNSQDVKHADLAADRQWNVDEQGYQVAKISEALGIDHRIAFATVLETLARVSRENAKT